MGDLPPADILDIFIGYDEREAAAYRVCERTLIRRSDSPLHVQPLKSDPLRQAGFFSRTWHEVEGQRIDDGDGRPFSTDFAFTRFLVPALMRYRGWALFVDCDFVFMADVGEIFACRDESRAVMVCQQRHEPREAIKMDGQVQTTYPRKNWSSLMLWNCGHPANRVLTTEAVSGWPGAWLHGFSWLKPEEIGDLPHEWNWIDGVTKGEPKAIHYTTGGPWFSDRQDVAHADRWRREAMLEEFYRESLKRPTYFEERR